MLHLQLFFTAIILKVNRFTNSLFVVAWRRCNKIKQQKINHLNDKWAAFESPQVYLLTKVQLQEMFGSHSVF